MNKLCGFFILIVLFSACYASEYLAILYNIPHSNRKEYLIFRQIQNDYLSIIDQSQLTHIQKQRLTYEILDTNPRENVYFLLKNSIELEPTVLRYGTILKRYDEFFLLKTVQIYADSIRTLPLRRENLDFTPISFEDQSMQRSTIGGSPNPLIVNILNDVSIDTLKNLVKKLQSFETRECSSEENKNVVSPWAKDLLAKYCDSVYLESVSSSCGPNIVGIRKGTKNPSLTNYCVIGGHFDAVTVNGPFKAAGADDNGTGTAATIECARVFKKYTFENSIKFVLFNGEEKNLLGSNIFAQNMQTNKHTIIGGAVTFDMLGHSSEASKDLIQLEGFDNNDANKKFITEFMRDVVQKYTKLKTFEYLKGFGSDHVSFNKKGFVSMLCIEREYESNQNKAYHKNFDTLGCPVGLNDMELFKNITKVGIAAIAVLAVPKDGTNTLSKEEISNRNPFSKVIISQTKNRIISITFATTTSQSKRINIYSAKGNLILSIKNNDQNVFIWDCSDETKITSGTYFVQLSMGTFSHTVKLLVI